MWSEIQNEYRGLMWLPSSSAPISWLNRMIQFMEKLRNAAFGHFQIPVGQLNLYNLSFVCKYATQSLQFIIWSFPNSS